MGFNSGLKGLKTINRTGSRTTFEISMEESRQWIMFTLLH